MPNYHNALHSNVFYSRYGDQTIPWINEQHEADLKILNRIACQLGLFVRVEFTCTELDDHFNIMTIENHRYSLTVEFDSTWFLSILPDYQSDDLTPHFEKFIERIKDAHRIAAIA